jgi:hypothetical protein
MPATRRPPMILPLALLAAVAASGLAREQADVPAPAQAVTIYRCVDAQGRLVALRDSPCLAGERQDIVQMQRPQDPPPGRAAPVLAAPAAPAPDVREVRIVTVQPPQPMFECTAPDGRVYTSESGEGDARWVPQWVVGVPMWGPHPRPPVPGPRPPIAGPGRPPVTGPGRPPVTGPGYPPVTGPGHRPPAVVVPAGGTWVRDPCVRLPQDEVCRRLSDRRFEILRIYHAAMPSGRAELDREQRLIDERLSADCRGS